MNDHTDAIILKQTDYRETAVLLTVLTPERGKLSFVANGARKITSKNAGSILPYTKADLLFDDREDKTIFKLKSASAIALNRHIREDLVISSAAAVMCECADLVTYDNPDPVFTAFLYQQLDLGLEYLNEHKNPDLILAVFLSSVLEGIGMGPAVDGCALCGDPKVIALSAKEGGFLCARHAPNKKTTEEDVKELRIFRLLCKADMQHIATLENLVGDVRKDVTVLASFFTIHVGMEIRSFAFYNAL